MTACIWDSDTLGSERRKKRQLSAIILNDPAPPSDQSSVAARLERLLAAPRAEDVDWLNNVAGAYLRLGQPQKAADLLAPAAARFTNDYGVQANLGTAYHLLGRYAEAERHIARDLQINPHAHFGLEKFHLALLQYLVRDVTWKKQRLYVDEYSGQFETARGPSSTIQRISLPIALNGIC